MPKRRPVQSLEVPAAAHPAVKRFFAVLRVSGYTVREIAEMAGVHHGAIYEWQRRSPRIDNIEAALNALGFTLQAVRLEESENEREQAANHQVPSAVLPGDGGA